MDAGSPRSEIGERLRRLREQRQWTLDDVARETGLSNGYLSLLERGHRQPSAASLAALAKAFEVSVSYLLGEQRHLGLGLDLHPGLNRIQAVLEDTSLSESLIRKIEECVAQLADVLEALAAAAVGRDLVPAAATQTIDPVDDLAIMRELTTWGNDRAVLSDEQ